MSEINNENLNQTPVEEQSEAVLPDNFDVPANDEIAENTEAVEISENKKVKSKKKKEKKPAKKEKKKFSGAEKLEELKKDAENLSSHTKRNIYLSFIAVVVFVAVIAAQFIFQSYLVTPRDSEIVNWMFVTGATHEHVEKAETFNQALSNNKISKPFGDKYVHCRYNLPDSEDDMMLKVVTEYSPIRILLNGEKIYDNGYEKVELVGNCYNEVIVPSSTQSRVLDMYIYYPSAFNLSAYYEPVGDTTVFSPSNILNNWTIYAGGVVVIAGIALILAVFCFMFKSRDVLRLMWLGAIIILTGVTIVFNEISTHSALVSSPLMFGLTYTMLSGVLCLSVLAVHFMMIHKNKLTVVTAVAVPVLAVLSCLSGSIALTKIAMALSAAAIAASAVLLVKELVHRDNLFVGHHSVIYVIGVFAILAYLFNALSFIIGLWNFSVFILTLAVVIFTLTLYIVYLRSIALKNLKEDLQDSQGAEYDKFFNAVSAIVTEPKGATSYEEYIESFCHKVEMFLTNSNLVVDKDALSCCAAVNINGAYKEVYTKNKTEECNYNYIAEHLRVLEERFTVGTSFIEIMLGTPDEKEAVILFNNAYSSANSGLVSFIRSLYVSASASYNKIYATNSLYQDVEQVFMNLANIAEERAFGTGKHLQMVAKITEILCKGMGFDDEMSKKISMASMLHDIGKITTSKELLNKREALTKEEKYMLKQHVVYGYNMLSGIEGEFFEIAKAIILEHHENYDGSGYIGRAGEDISIYGRIVKVADVFDALASVRQYKDRWSYEDIITYIVERSGTEFDPAVVKVFLANGMEIISVKESEND